ncbi:uncharacterized protein LOC131669947 [Phymastichus coffea]|uniref:uncharacterized protein LOC131669947 n=1 Tax=Phymastichus coffea TaxID=108790 RepID=UPI00273C4C8C|nr:uncharacterized protein LOC131669947 [Phymastichus coffea]
MVRRKATARSSQSSDSASQTEVIVKRNRKQVNRNYVIQEIRKLQRLTKLLIPRAPFARLVRHIIRDLFPLLNIQRIQYSALEALQESVEMYLVQFFEDAILVSLHCNRVTVMQKDIILVRRLRGRGDIINR